jgi:hypothetical protein
MRGSQRKLLASDPWNVDGPHAFILTLARLAAALSLVEAGTA